MTPETLIRKAASSTWIGFVIFVNISTLTAFGLAWLPGGLNPAAALIGMLAGLIGVVAVRKHHRTSELIDSPPSQYWIFHWLGVLAFTLFAVRVFCWHTITRSDDFCILSPNNISDFPLHAQYINFFAQGATMWPSNPFKSGNSICYPFGMDFFNAILTSAGLDLLRGIVIVGLFASIATAAALFAYGRTLGIAAFLFNSGTVGWAFFNTGELIDYQQTVDWKSIPLSLFVTQRGFLYAIPAGLLLLHQWTKIEFSPQSEKPLSSWVEVLIYCTMPLFHLHTFMFLSVILGCRLIWGRHRQHTIKVLIWSVLPATILTFLLTDRFTAASHVSFQLGWLQGNHFSLFYWLKNFGGIPVYFGWLLCVVIRRTRSSNKTEAEHAKRVLIFIGPAIFIFIASLFFKFAPWAWDNTKFFAWSTIVIIPFLWREVVQNHSLSFRMGTCFILFFSGFISLWGGIGPEFKGFEIAKRSEIAQVAGAVEAIPIQAVFATAQEYAHPLVMNGRRLVLGFNGHAVGHGLNVDEQRKNLNNLMNGDEGWQEAAKKVGADYVF